jgi:hypothetical protein
LQVGFSTTVYQTLLSILCLIWMLPALFLSL